VKDTLHHIPNIENHFSEVSRVLKVGGKIVYAEPNWNFISKLVFKYLHPEPWDENIDEWNFSSSDPMFSNQALPMIIFKRDLEKFNKLFPNLQVNVVSTPLAGLSFLLSGGVYKNSIFPDFVLSWLRRIENKSTTWMKISGFVRIILLTKSI
jgi:SAM-dependent methyltransferase